MVQVDLITGFLGSGKTTFLRRYAKYWVEQGQNVCILENDFGAVNVDVVLLQDVLGEHCDMESISGGCDCDTHQRRMRTKLIALAMRGFDRVLVEPSGIFDVDEFFDILWDEPLDRWYRLGSVIAIVDAALERDLSPQSAYLLASEAANAGMVVLSRCQQTTPEQAEATVQYLNRALEQNGCSRRFGADVLRKNWDELTPEDMERIAACGYRQSSYVKLHFDQHDVFSSLYFLERGLPPERLRQIVPKLFADEGCGRVMRVKGFARGENGWQELNATRDGIEWKPLPNAQDVLIVIGEQLNRERIEAYWAE